MFKAKAIQLLALVSINPNLRFQLPLLMKLSPHLEIKIPETKWTLKKDLSNNSKTNSKRKLRKSKKLKKEWRIRLLTWKRRILILRGIKVLLKSYPSPYLVQLAVEVSNPSLWDPSNNFKLLSMIHGLLLAKVNLTHH